LATNRKGIQPVKTGCWFGDDLSGALHIYSSSPPPPLSLALIESTWKMATKNGETERERERERERSADVIAKCFRCLFFGHAILQLFKTVAMVHCSGQSDTCETLTEGRYEFNFSFELPLE